MSEIPESDNRPTLPVDNFFQVPSSEPPFYESEPPAEPKLLPRRYSKLKVDRRISIQNKRSQISGAPENTSQSLASVNSGFSSNAGSRAASIGGASSQSDHRHITSRDITESFLIKLYSMKWTCLALMLNILMLVFCLKMYDGVTLPIDVDISHTFICIVFEMIFIGLNYLTHVALDDGAAVLFGYKICSRRGLSVATCGFFQTHTVMKPVFANNLSISSTVKKQLTWVSILWVVVYVFEWVIPLTPIGVTSEGLRTNSGSVPCLIYGQDYTPFERLMPSIAYESGVAEVVFGSALGIMRSEVPGVNVTTAIVSPQIIGVVKDGDTILGSGFSIDISSRCGCQRLTAAAELVSAQGISLSDATDLYNAYLTLNNSFGLANRVYSNSTDITIYSIISGATLCGGYNSTSTFTPVCKTRMNNHMFADILVNYMTDGTTASIAIKSASILGTTGTADISTWAFTAMKNVMGGSVSAQVLPNVIPSVLNPLFWWTTPNLIGIDHSLLDAGIETLFAILFRGSVQRTYSAKGYSCTANVATAGLSIVQFQGVGYYVAIIGLCVHLIIAFLAALAFIPWFIIDHPIGPGIRLIRDKTYCMTVLTQSALLYDAGELSNAPTSRIWNLVDVVCRMGESLNTAEDPEFGTMALDTPRSIMPFKNGKNYS